MSGQSIDQLLMDMQEHGFDTKNFPVEYQGHRLEASENVAYFDDETGRMRYNLRLWCWNCKEQNAISGRVPDGVDQIGRVESAKFAAFEKFKYMECE